MKSLSKTEAVYERTPNRRRHRRDSLWTCEHLAAVVSEKAKVNTTNPAYAPLMTLLRATGRNEAEAKQFLDKVDGVPLEQLKAEEQRRKKER